MESFILQNDTGIRVGIFIGVLIFMFCLEFLIPRRGDPVNWQRRLNNIALVGIDVLLVRLIVPVAVVGMAIICKKNEWGILNQFELTSGLAVIISIVLLDLAVYAQHVVLHYVGFLWQFHKVHHTDMTFDVTTAIRFHPIEILLSTIYKMIIVIILGPPVIAAILFEIILSSSAMFNHSNIKIPVFFDKWLRYLIVTPDMHRVHHSIYKNETNSNFGFFIPWWDHFFKTYCDQPGTGHEKMTLGLNEFRDNRSIGIQWLLMQPFLSPHDKQKEI